jgi:hypothetical protein
MRDKRPRGLRWRYRDNPTGSLKEILKTLSPEGIERLRHELPYIARRALMKQVWPPIRERKERSQ